MKKIALMFFLVIALFSFAEEQVQEKTNEKTQEIKEQKKTINTRELYENLKIKDKIDYSLFQKAYLGYIQIPNKNSGILVIIDYTKPSNLERFFVIDFDKNKLVYSSRVAHSKNSGLEIPLQFSDDPNSYQSSLGFFLTAGEYNGAYGYSLRLKGLEENINSNAEERAIVIHGGEIVEDSYIKKYGFAGRSLGCPVLPYSKSKEIINYIKNGRVLFIYGNDEDYIENSTYLSSLIPLVSEKPQDIVQVKIPEPKVEIKDTEIKSDSPIESKEVREEKIEKISVVLTEEEAKAKQADYEKVLSTLNPPEKEKQNQVISQDKIQEKNSKYPKESLRKSLGNGVKPKRK